MPQKPFKMTVARQLFTTPFRCKIPELHRHDETYLREIGHHTTGNKAWDKELMNQLVDVYLTPVRMVELFSIGSPVVFIYPPDAYNVYELLRKHLENWQMVIEKSLHPQNPPMDDLRAMEEFCQAIYPLAKVYMPKDMPVSGFMGKLMGLGSRTPLGAAPSKSANPADVNRRVFSPDLGRRFRNQENTENPEAQEADNQVQEITSVHTPIADSISRMRFKRTGKWQ